MAALLPIGLGLAALVLLELWLGPPPVKCPVMYARFTWNMDAWRLARETALLDAALARHRSPK